MSTVNETKTYHMTLMSNIIMT